MVASYSRPSKELLILSKPHSSLLPLIVVLDQTGRAWDLLGWRAGSYQVCLMTAKSQGEKTELLQQEGISGSKSSLSPLPSVVSPCNKCCSQLSESCTHLERTIFSL